MFSLVGCTIIEPKELNGISGEDASFKWNSSINNIVSAKWGLCTHGSNTVSIGFISVNLLGGHNVVYNYGYLNSSRYRGRVKYVGDIKKGHAWFVIKNLSYEDAGPYCAKLTEGPKQSPGPTVYSRVTLKVVAGKSLLYN